MTETRYERGEREASEMISEHGGEAVSRFYDRYYRASSDPYALGVGATVWQWRHACIDARPLLGRFAR